MNAETAILLIKLIDLAVFAAKEGGQALERYQERKAQVEAMIYEGRDPTEEEFEDLELEIDQLRGRLHGAGR